MSEEKEKEELLVNKDENIDDTYSKTKIIILYGATVGGMLLVVIIVFLVALLVGGSSSEKLKNTIIAKYSIQDSDT